MKRMKPVFDAAREADRIASFITRVVAGASAKGVVVGLSGGIDSAVTGSLCVKALGKAKVLGLLMPSDHTPNEDIKDARTLAKRWGIKTETVPISKLVEPVVVSVPIEGTKVARANVEARIRMVILYFHANSLGYLVAGTDDRSENLLGYFTKFGDGGVDFLPISHLYKTQVRELGAFLGIPRRILQKPPSPQLWAGHKASDEIPADYEKLDAALHALYDLKTTPHQAALAAGLPVSAIHKVIDMHRKTEHKRNHPPSLS